jgi:hypothetical protein
MCLNISILRHVIVIGWSNIFCKSCLWIFRLIGRYLSKRVDPLIYGPGARATCNHKYCTTYCRKLSPHTNLDSLARRRWATSGAAVFTDTCVVQAPRRVPIESSPHPWIQWLTPIEMDNCSCLANRTTTGKLHVKEKSHRTVRWLHIAGSIVEGDG